MSRRQFDSLRAASLFCPKCACAMPVRERLLLVLPDKDLFEYLCTGCGGSLGRREVTAQPLGPPGSAGDAGGPRLLLP